MIGNRGWWIYYVYTRSMAVDGGGQSARRCAREGDDDVGSEKGCFLPDVVALGMRNVWCGVMLYDVRDEDGNDGRAM